MMSPLKKTDFRAEIGGILSWEENWRKDPYLQMRKWCSIQCFGWMIFWSYFQLAEIIQLFQSNIW